MVTLELTKGEAALALIAVDLYRPISLGGDKERKKLIEKIRVELEKEIDFTDERVF